MQSLREAYADCKGSPRCSKKKKRSSSGFVMSENRNFSRLLQSSSEAKTGMELRPTSACTS